MNPFITKEESKRRKLAELGDYAFTLEGHQAAFTREIARLKRDGVEFAVTKGTGKNGYAHVHTWVTIWAKPAGPRIPSDRETVCKADAVFIRNKKGKS